MELQATYIRGNILESYRANWTYKLFRCRLKATEEGITIVMRGGAETMGAPGEEITFFRQVQNLEEAVAFIQKLPEKFGPRTCVRLGFKEMGHVLLN